MLFIFIIIIIIIFLQSELSLVSGVSTVILSELTL